MSLSINILNVVSFPNNKVDFEVVQDSNPDDKSLVTLMNKHNKLKEKLL